MPYATTSLFRLHAGQRWSAARALRSAAYAFTTRLLLFAYTVLLLKPVMPVLQDRVAHRFHAASHFRMVHSHDGQRHVHDAMAKTVEDDDDPKPASNTVKTAKEEVCIPVDRLLLPPLASTAQGQQQLLPSADKVLNMPAVPIGPPPRV